MPQPDQQNPFDPDRYRDAEAQLGGADDVEKTTYVLGEGTRPERRRTDRAAPSGSRGSGLLIAIVVALIAVVAIVYLVGMAR
jgi:hypothetical protein